MASNYGDKPWKTKLKRDVFLGQADIKKSRTNNVYIYGNLEVDKKITFKKEISGNTCRLERKNQLLIFSCVDSLNPLKKLRYKTDCKNENFLSANLTKTVDRGNKDFYKEKFMISVGCVNNKKILYKNSKMEPLKESTL